MVKNYSKMATNDPKQAKMTKNGPKWSEMFRKMVQMRPEIPIPNYVTSNGEILTKLQQNCQKIQTM